MFIVGLVAVLFIPTLDHHVRPWLHIVYLKKLTARNLRNTFLQGEVFTLSKREGLSIECLKGELLPDFGERGWWGDRVDCGRGGLDEDRTCSDG